MEAAVLRAEEVAKDEKDGVRRAEAAVLRAEAAVLRAEKAVKQAQDKWDKAEEKYQKERGPQEEKIFQSSQKRLEYAVTMLSSAQDVQKSAQDTQRSAQTGLHLAIKAMADLQLGSKLPKREGSNEHALQTLPFNEWVEISKKSLAHIKATDCDITNLCDPAVLSELWLPLMDLRRTPTKPRESTARHVPAKFSFMGRVEFQMVFDWIRGAPSGDQSYYTGLPGGGKSYIFAAAALLLFKEFEASTETPRRRLIYLQGNRYVTDPFQCLLQALVLAYSDDPSKLRDITCKKQLDDWMSYQEDHLFFLVDDGEAVAMDERVEARRLLENVASRQSLVLCSSVCGDVHARIFSQKQPRYHLASPTFTEAEVTHYLEHFKPGVDKSEELRRMTGWVPRLLWLYGTDGFEMAIVDLLAEVDKYIKGAEGKKLEEFMKVVAGQDCLNFPKALLSKCFYSKDGKGACLTDSLLHMTKAKLFETLEQSNDEDNTRRIQIWTQTMPRETLKSRLGQNAEAAAILAVKFGTTIKIDGKTTVKFSQPSAVIAFDREPRFREPSQPFLHIPNDFRHAGLDFYYEDSEVIVCFQVTVATHPVGTHPDTLQTFLKVTEGDKRDRYLIWVVHGKDSRVEKRDGYFEVFCCFRDLHYLLKSVDEAGIRIDGENTEAKVAAK